MKFMFGLHHPLTCNPWTTLSNPCNKVRGKYNSKEVFLRLPSCIFVTAFLFLRPLFVRLILVSLWCCRWLYNSSGYLLWLVVERRLMCWHIVYCFSSCAIWKTHNWTSDVSLIRELRLYEFEPDHHVTEASKNIWEAKSEDSTVTKWFKNFHDQAEWSRHKTLDSEAMLKTIDANPPSGTRGVTGEIDIS